MTKELQDHVWKHCLPKEFKEKVKKIYCTPGHRAEVYTLLQNLFGAGNLTSDAEGEEMLMVGHKVIQEAYAANERIKKEYPRSIMYKQSDAVNGFLWGLFGSKCLPDNVDSSEPNVDSLHDNVDSLPQNPTENCDNKSHISADCNKPAEPKFKIGDKVRYRPSGEVYEVEGKTGRQHYALKGWLTDIVESDLEPYTEPSKVESATLHAESVEESRNASEESNLSNSSQDCDEWFDTIIKRGFRADRRCNIAVQMIKAMMSCPEIIDRISSAEADSLLDDILHDALYLTDNLIAECEKGADQ
jgi:hypothetical protein